MADIVVEDGTGLDDANSYVSLAEADAYLLDTPLAQANQWNELGDDVKSSLLIYSTRVLDQRVRWTGAKSVAGSALRWPRSGVLDADNVPVAQDEVPKAVKQAVMELALWFSIPGQNPMVTAENQGIQSLGVDVINIQYMADHDATAVAAFPRGLNQILTNLGTFQYLGRAGFGPINKV